MSDPSTVRNAHPISTIGPSVNPYHHLDFTVGTPAASQGPGVINDGAVPTATSRTQP